MGFCMGGSIAFLAGYRLYGLSAAVAYYGGADRQVRRREAEGPDADAFRRDGPGHPDDRRRDDQAKAADSEIYAYPDAGHGFHCDERGSYHEPRAKVAWPRALDFLKKQ